MVTTATSNKRQAASVQKRFGTERDVETLTGVSMRTLQQDRLRGIKRFPWYRAGRKILYDLNEVQAIITSSRVDAAGPLGSGYSVKGAASKCDAVA